MRRRNITSQVLRGVRTHWILTRSALDMVDVGAESGDKLNRIPVRDFFSRVRAHEEREPMESLHPPLFPSIASRQQSAIHR